MQDIRGKIRRGIRIFLIITILTMMFIIFRSIRKETFEALKKMSPLWMLISVACAGLRYYFDIFRIRWIARGLGKDLSWNGCVYFLFGGYFLGAVTPFQSGGLPFQIFVMKREGIDYGEGLALIFMRGILSGIILPFVLPIMFTQTRAMETTFFRVLTRYLVVIYGGIFLLMILSIFLPQVIKKIFRGKLLKGAEEFRDAFVREYRKRPGALGLALLGTLLTLFFYFLGTPTLLRGLGVEVNFFKGMVYQMILTYALNFAPTPGASGIAEMGGFKLFSEICPQELLGVYVLLWRFFTGHIGVIIGGFTMLKLISEYEMEEGKK